MLIVAGLVLPFWHRFGENFVAIMLHRALSIGQLYVVWMLGITSDLHIFFTLAGAMLFFFGIQNWKLFLGFFFYAAALLLFVAQLRAGRRLAAAGRRTACAICFEPHADQRFYLYAAMIFYALALVNRAEVELEQQYERSEALIATVMPAPIAARLKASEERIADRIETLERAVRRPRQLHAAAHDLPPEEIVGFLDGLVRAFDALAEQHGVEKIKTVGDSYMAAAGFDGRGATARSRSGASRSRCWRRTPRIRRSAAASSSCASASIAGRRPPA